MRGFCLLILAASLAVADKLSFDERVEITRGLTAEYATAKVLIPRSKKALVFHADGTWDKSAWDEALKTNGPAARVGDLLQITKVDINDDHIVFEINGGLKSGRKWYERIEVGMGNRTTPISQGGSAAPGGTTIALHFKKPVPAMKAAEFKALFKPILDFERRSATEAYVDNLPPEIKKAIQEKKAVVGMDRDQVLLAVGPPRRKTRDNKDGVESEDWIYGEPPGKITFVTFQGSKVAKVRDLFAGLGGSTVPTAIP
jgi:phenolic acid decarboxylase